MQPNSIASATRAALVAAALVCLGLCAAISAALSPAQTKDAVKVKAKAETYYYLVFSNPVAGKEDEYNKWYDTQHAQDVVAVPGFVTAQRFVASETPLRTTTPPAKYLVIYKIVTDDLAAVTAEVSRRLETGMTVLSPTFDRASSSGTIYKTISPIIDHKGDAPSAPKGKVETYYQLVLSNPVAGKEDEYNRWYEQQHGPDVASVPGFVNWQRLKFASGGTRQGRAEYQYLVVYKIVTDNLPSVIDTFRQRSRKMATSPAFGENVGYTYKTWGPLIEGDQVRADRVRTGNR